MWRLMPGLVLRSQTWDGEEYVLYNNLAGDTHLLDAAAMEVLTLLQVEAMDTARLTAVLGLEGQGDAMAYLTDLLQQLQRLSLAEEIPA